MAMPGSNTLKNKFIMVVDDEPQILGLLELTLGRPGYTILTASSGENALRMLDTAKPDLFIVDMLMPDMDGLELCRQLRERADTATRPILVISVRHDPETVEKALSAGADELCGSSARSSN
jgi:DNA-binding response OmpR family regulator